ncbi:hypothetical protein QV08_01230 [Gallibacterium salpingitidis]|uniref:Antitermination protein n=1 Tax=Gallibacterium salpingitidis TaxID=505341 RepID=A0AB36E3V7_9PAST|nr:TIGR02642 family protein [Gallibacterium salpingitidis]OBX09591.1 hypothetical protein QV08_01230 [Gallibacterium salpingitidis]OBX10446.1 hypothetical protein QV09_05785 [Gallibacterium salpingitidis]
MSREIELLVKMFEPRCVSFEAVAHCNGNLHKDQIIAAFAKAERQHWLGYQMLSLKYKLDNDAKHKLAQYIDLYLKDKNISDHYAAKALNLVVDMLADIPLPTQHKRLSSLRRRYLRSQFAYTKEIDKANKIAEQAGIDRNSKDGRTLKINAINEMKRTNICPRCHGTGEIGREQKRSCPSCEGKGRLIATVDHLIYAIGCSKEHFDLYLKHIILEFTSKLQYEMSDAESLIKQRLRAEIAA